MRKAAWMIFASWAISAASLVFVHNAAQAAPVARARSLPPLREAVGRIERIDVHANQLTVDGQSLRVDPATTIFLDGHTGTLADLAEGEVVRAAYETGTAAPTAQWIERATEKR